MENESFIENRSVVYDIADKKPSTDTPDRNYDDVATVLVSTVLLIIIVVTVFMNALIIIAFCISREVRKLNNYFFFSLAITDILMGAFVMPLMATEQLTGSWPYGKALCQTWLSMDYFLSSASVFNMIVICIDRYMNIIHPLSYPSRRTPGFVVKMIIIAWILGFLTEVPAILLWEPVSGESMVNYTHSCEIEWVYNVPYQVTSTVATVLVPFVIMIIMYSRMLCAVEKSMNWIRKHSLAPTPSPSPSMSLNRYISVNVVDRDFIDNGSLNAQRGLSTSTLSIARTSLQKSPSQISNVRKNKKSKRTRILNDKKTATTLGILLAFFAVSWLPWQAVSIIDATCNQFCVPIVVYDICLWLQYSNSMVNPFLYIFRDTSFRTAVKKILGWCTCRKQSSNS
ncbi:histamine H3 receptor-like [Ptychodera flava]|uniref:histamine H3 receptor-like n=1 Tax=Ptychodera flava TaxID=63121 RepID=UPI003969D19D